MDKGTIFTIGESSRLVVVEVSKDTFTAKYIPNGQLYEGAREIELSIDSKVNILGKMNL